MQPSGKESSGKHALKIGLAPDEVQRRMNWALARVSDYDGVNNHMSSRFTESRADVTTVMREMKSRRLFFLDSGTTEKSQVENVAHEVGALSGRRDIFLDARETPRLSRESLRAPKSLRDRAAMQSRSVILIPKR